MRIWCCEVIFPLQLSICRPIDKIVILCINKKRKQKNRRLLTTKTCSPGYREGQIRFSLSLRPILGRTEEEAWNRAQRILEQAKALKERGAVSLFRAAKNESTGSQRLQGTANGGPIRDKRLWTEIAKLTGAQGNSTSLVGTPEQVVDALLDYYDLGITKFLFRGFDPLEDAIDYGRNLLPLLRQTVAQHGQPRALATG